MRELNESRECAFSFLKYTGNIYTINAPRVIPNIAIDMDINAKWYHIVTLKIRVRRISYIRVESVVRNNPTKVFVFGAETVFK